MRIVMALGGNALLPREAAPEHDVQRRHIAESAAAIADIARRHEVIITHGNGPQIGLLALQALAHTNVAPYPLDVLGAQTQGMLGYLIAQALTNHLGESRVAAVLTQARVNPLDPAFKKPSKPIGPIYSDTQVRELAARRAWTFTRDGAGWRRALPSPEPLEILELPAIRSLTNAGFIVVCCGGGGIPVVKQSGNTWTGVEAVIDKDLTSALLATHLGADGLLLLTDVDAVYADWPTRNQPIDEITPELLRQYKFDAGSMNPKVEAASRFVEQTGGFASIGQLTEASALLTGRRGTRVSASKPDLH